MFTRFLYAAIFAGLLAKRDKPEHVQTLADHALPEIDLVVCNLYPFEQTVAKPGVTEAEAIENIDIGGPSMVRSAAKNHAYIGIVTGPEQYEGVLDALRSGPLTHELKRELAGAAFAMTAHYLIGCL